MTARNAVRRSVPKGELPDFTPVPRRIERVDGWTPERQRGFIAALAVTGSARRAAKAVGKSASGVERLREAKGATSFAAAWDAAMAMAGEADSRRLAEGVGAVTGIEPDPDEAGELTPAEKKVRLELLSVLVRNYLLKVEAERRVRLEGRIAEADFYLRQLTMIEVSLDGISEDGMKLLRDVRLGGFELVDIAETPMSRLLDCARRKHWEQCGDPPRPEYPPRHLLKEKDDGLATEPMPVTWGGLPESHEEQWRRIEEQFARDAEEHFAWEAEARRDYERRRAAPPVIGGEPGEAGQPAPKGRQD